MFFDDLIKKNWIIFRISSFRYFSHFSYSLISKISDSYSKRRIEHLLEHSPRPRSHSLLYCYTKITTHSSITAFPKRFLFIFVLCELPSHFLWCSWILFLLLLLLLLFYTSRIFPGLISLALVCIYAICGSSL